MRRSLSLTFFLLLLSGMSTGPVGAHDLATCLDGNSTGARTFSDCSAPWFSKPFDSAFSDRRNAPMRVANASEPDIAAGIPANDRAACENWKNAVEAAIAACSRLIASINMPARELSNVYWWRGLALSSSARNDPVNVSRGPGDRLYEATGVCSVPARVVPNATPTFQRATRRFQ